MLETLYKEALDRKKNPKEGLIPLSFWTRQDSKKAGEEAWQVVD